MRRTVRTATKTEFVCDTCKLTSKAVPSKSIKPKPKPRKTGENPQGPSKPDDNKSAPSCSAGLSNPPPVGPHVWGGRTDHQLEHRSETQTPPGQLPPTMQGGEAAASQEHVTTQPTDARSAIPCHAGMQSSDSLDCLKAYYTKEEVTSLLSRVESSIRAEFNLQILNLQEQVSQLSQTIHVMNSKVSKPPPTYASRVTMHIPKSHSGSRAIASTTCTRQHNSFSVSPSCPSNNLPFRIVWGTSSQCTVEVLSKALCPLLHREAADALIIKRSVRHLQNSRRMWWFTIMAPLPVIQQIEQCWPTLESKTSWSLKLSLSQHNVPASADSAHNNDCHNAANVLTGTIVSETTRQDTDVQTTAVNESAAGSVEPSSISETVRIAIPLVQLVTAEMTKIFPVLVSLLCQTHWSNPNYHTGTAQLYLPMLPLLQLLTVCTVTLVPQVHHLPQLCLLLILQLQDLSSSLPHKCQMSKFFYTNMPPHALLH